MGSVLELAHSLALVSIFLSTSTFVFLYFFRGSWKHSRLGRAMLLQAMSWGITVFLVTFGRLIHSPVWNEWTSTLSLVFVAFSQGYMLKLLYEAQRIDKSALNNK